MKHEYEVHLKFSRKLSTEAANYFTSYIWTDQYIYSNKLYTGGFCKENIGEYIIGSEQLDKLLLKDHIISTIIPFLNCLQLPYIVNSFDLYLWDYSIPDIEEPDFLETYYI